MPGGLRGLAESKTSPSEPGQKTGHVAGLSTTARQRLDMATVPLSSSKRVQETARDLDVVIDSRLSLSDHVAAVCLSGYYQLRQLRPVVRCSSEDAAKSRPLLLVAWITVTRCLQSVQNAAVRLVAGTRRCDHIWPVLRQLHWLPVRQRVVFKIATLVHQSLSGNAPGYLADDCQLVADARVRLLRSADTRTIFVSRTRSSFGDRTRTFAIQDHKSGTVCRPISDYVGCHAYGRFRRLQKTLLFRQ